MTTSEATIDTVTNDTVTTPGKKVVKKVSKKVSPVVKKAAGKKATKAAPKSSGGPSIRERVFALLNKSPNGLTGGQIKDKLGLGGIPSLLKDEGVCDKPRIKRISEEGVRGVLYTLTALGKKAVEKGTVDSEAAPLASGQEWPAGR